MPKFLFAAAYEKSLSQIEDFIFESTTEVRAVEQFLSEHDRVLIFLGNNPGTPPPHPEAGDQSWPFAGGRYRVFFKSMLAEKGEVTLYMTHIIDNRMANAPVYPGNKMPSVDED